MAEKFKSEPYDIFIQWRWGDANTLVINRRYYLEFMPKYKRIKLDNMMKRLDAKMEEL